MNQSKLPIAAIIVGMLNMAIYCFEYFFIMYFTSIGLPERGSAFLLSLLLTIGGLYWGNYRSLGKAFIIAFMLGTLVDRILVSSLFPSGITIQIIFQPLLSMLIIWYFWYHQEEVSTIKAKHKILAFLLALLVIFWPKATAISTLFF